MNKKIAIIGLGYVGLPLAVEFGKKYSTIGFDINKRRIKQLRQGIDLTEETSKKDIVSSSKLIFTTNISQISECNIFIISVPTPINKNKKPNLKLLFNASKNIAPLLKKNDIVIYESTVYPGCTEEDCVPILEKYSSLKYNKDFYCGYSPERINPGDKQRTLTKIVKITSGSNKRIAKIVDDLYKSIIKAGTYKAKSIKIAEAAKIIENCQRDINIAFVNELSILFNKMNLDTSDILEAAGTKWNFLPFKPGLVGGHCIGVDPYYLTYKAKKVNYNSKIILSGRKLNDSMSSYIVNEIILHFKNLNMKISKIKVLILGITFKENCTDTRNSKVIDIYNLLIKNKMNVEVHDPFASKEEVYKNYKIKLIDMKKIKKNYFDCVLIAVSHKQFKILDFDSFLISNNSFVYDLKGTSKNKQYKRL